MPEEIDGVPLEALSCTFIPARLSGNRFLRDTAQGSITACSGRARAGGRPVGGGGGRLPPGHLAL